jgi:hypothetical protein
MEDKSSLRAERPSLNSQGDDNLSSERQTWARQLNEYTLGRLRGMQALAVLEEAIAYVNGGAAPI